jgi:hypothetical protein
MAIRGGVIFVTNTPAPFLTKWDRLHRLYVELSLMD